MIYNLVITGGIGSGKTTMIRELSLHLSSISDYSLNILPEYIDGPDATLGKMMLNGYLSNPQTVEDISFQNYIIRYYELRYQEIADKMKNTENVINIMERTPSDSLLIFANIAHDNGRLSDSAYKKLFERVMNLDRAFNMPNFIIHNYEFTHLDLSSISIDIILQIIQKDITAGISMNRIIYLDIPYEICYRRMKIRGRPEETTYTEDDIMNNCSFYKILSKYIHNGTIQSITYKNSDMLIT